MASIVADRVGRSTHTTGTVLRASGLGRYEGIDLCA
jgi:hypothetical protein